MTAYVDFPAGADCGGTEAKRQTAEAEALLRGVPEKGGLEYYYQPICDARTGRIAKAEVLLRVRDQQGGFLDTEAFIAAAEKLGLIGVLDRKAFRHTCTCLPEFRARGIDMLSFNLSPASCRNPHIVPALKGILAETGADPAALCIEITEEAAAKDDGRLVEVMRALYHLGFHLALDDFGKGSSTIQRIISTPFHVLKLDRSLVWSLEGQSPVGGQCLAKPLLASLIRFAHENGITIVAEGVETEAQARQLARMGCHFLQGYFFSPPVPKKQFFQLLDKKTLLDYLGDINA